MNLYLRHLVKTIIQRVSPRNADTTHWNFQNNHPMNNVNFKLFTLNFEKIIICSHITLENYWAAIWLVTFCKRLKLWPHYNFKVMELIIKKLIILWSCTFLNSFLFPFFFCIFFFKVFQLILFLKNLIKMAWGLFSLNSGQSLW